LSYRKGYSFERRVKRTLERKGYFVVRSAGSKFPDLIALDKNGKAYIIECKVNRRSFTKQELNTLKALAEKYNCTPLIFYRRGLKLKMESLGKNTVLK